MVRLIQFYRIRNSLLSALKQMDFEHFEGIDEFTKPISYTLKRVNVALQNGNLESVATGALKGQYINV